MTGEKQHRKDTGNLQNCRSDFQPSVVVDVWLNPLFCKRMDWLVFTQRHTM